jgi:transposase
MPRAYSDDLRCKILQSYARAELGLEELAEQFGVSYGFTKKIRRQQLQSGQMERPAQLLHGPASRVTESVQQYLRLQLRRQPDQTLAELGLGLEQSLQVRLSKTRLWLELRRMGLRRKKNLSTPKSRTRKKVGGGDSRGGSR